MPSRTTKAVILRPRYGSRATARPSKAQAHTSFRDRQIWNSLERGGWLAVYQHLDRRPEWLSRKAKQLMEGCRHSKPNVITGTGIEAEAVISELQTQSSRLTRTVERTETARSAFPPFTVQALAVTRREFDDYLPEPL
jgi:hypothetical protein